MLEVYTYNAGKGDCIRLRFAENHNIFIDSGVIRFAPTFRRICNEIAKSGERLDALILTHVDDDHIGGILGNLRQHSYQGLFDEVWMNHSGGAGVGDRTLSVQHNDEVYARLINREIKVRSMHKDDRWQIAGAVIETFWPEKSISSNSQNRQYRDAPLARHSDYQFSLSELADMPLPVQDSSRSNKQSIVFTFQFENHRLLFTGDAWAKDVIKAKGQYDLVKLPHHGSARNISEDYKDNIHSVNFLICTDGVSHPDKQTIAKLEKWYSEINIFSPSSWWKSGYFTAGDKNHRINYYQKEGLVIAW